MFCTHFFNALDIVFRRIIMYPKGNKNSLGYLSLSIYLDISEIDNFHKEWRRYVNLELAVTNQADASLTIVKGMFHNNNRFYIFGIQYHGIC
jgi:hypothetical protein